MRERGTPRSVEEAKSLLFDQLARAPRTRAQLQAFLRRKGIPEDVAQEALERLSELGLVDDAAFAAAWVAERRRSRGLAPAALAAELRRRGVEPDVVRETVGSVGPEEIETTAVALLRRRAAATDGLPPEVRARRLLGMLARRGYPPDIASRAVRRVLGDLVDGASAAVEEDTVQDMIEPA